MYFQGGKHLSALRLPLSLSVQKKKKKPNREQHHNHKMKNGKRALLGSWLQLSDVGLCPPKPGAGSELSNILDKNCLTKNVIKFKRGL